MKKCLILLAFLVLLCGITLLVPSSGQEKVAPAAQPAASSGPNTAAIAVELPHPLGLPHPYPAGFSPAQSEIRKLMSQLRETEDQAKKADLTKQLEAAVAKHFDEDVKARETELTKLEERLKKLRVQLERRSKAKAELIQLQVKVLVNEAEGLGFSGASSFGYGSALSPQPMLPQYWPPGYPARQPNPRK